MPSSGPFKAQDMSSGSTEEGEEFGEANQNRRLTGAGEDNWRVPGTRSPSRVATRPSVYRRVASPKNPKTNAKK